MRPASGVPGECFSLKDRVDDAVDPTDEDDFVFEVTEEELEAEEEDVPPNALARSLRPIERPETLRKPAPAPAPKAAARPKTQTKTAKATSDEVSSI